jgi:DNA polymerase-3 subunit alpha
MKTAQVISGYSLGQADLLRRGVGKKKPEVIAAEKPKFINGAIANGYEEELAIHLFELIEYFSGYGFNKSHACGYSFLSYATAYLKYYFPSEFYAAIMTVEGGKSASDSQLKLYMQDCYKKKIKILPPNVNESLLGFVSVNQKIRFGLNSIKGLGDKAIIEIIDKKPFNSFEDFFNKVDKRVVNKTSFEALIKAGAFDEFNPNRNQLLKDYKQLRKNGALTMSLFGVQEETTEQEITEMEAEVLGMSITNPTEWDLATDRQKLEIEGEIVSTREHKTKNGSLMVFCDVQTKYNKITCLGFSKIYKPNHDLFQKGFIVKINGKKSENSLLIDDIELIEGDLYKKGA